jgi:diguanylate cyclase (GGDEF)-like protein
MADIPQTSTSDGPMRELTELLAQVSRCETEASAGQLAVTLTASAVGADFCALIRDRSVMAATCLPDARVPGPELADAAAQGLARCAVPGLGRLELCAPALVGEPPMWLLVGRLGDRFTETESDLISTVADVLGLTLRVARVTRHQQGLRRRREHEIRQRERAERELAHQALHDRLTGLPNRDLMADRAKHALEHARHSDGFVAALFIDLDHFKLANDSLDPSRGDQLLVSIARRLTVIASLEPGGPRSLTLGQRGGDEFIVLCENLGTERDAIGIAQEISDALRAPFFIDSHEIKLTASIGIAFASPEQLQADRLDGDGLLGDAHVALTRAKELGRDRYEIFNEQMRVHLLDRVALEADLRAGLERGELRLLYQPVVTAADQTLAAVEALVRWQHPTRGLLGPGEFVNLAEESDLIVALGAWVIEEACEQIKRWREAHPAQLGVRVSVNVSARQLSPELVDTVQEALARSGVQPSQLALEITESLLIEQTESAREVLAALKAVGVSIVLDDFGTGYSSLGYLNEFPLDQLKLDRSFVAELDRDPRSAKIVAATIEMGRALGMTVVAEGVETPEQLAVLQRLGCDFVQGFLCARPEPAAAIFQRVRDAYQRDSEVADRRTPAHPRLQTSLPRLAAQAPDATDAAESHHLRTLGRMAGLLYLIGGVLALPADLVMGAPSPRTVLLLMLMGVLTGVACLIVPWDRLSPRWLELTAALATLEVTVSVVSDGRYATVLTSFYVLIANAVAYAFRDRRVIVAQITLAVVAMALPPLLLADQPRDAMPRTLVAILVLVVTSGVIVYLRERVEASASALRELATSDPLTQVGNYRLLHERLEYELTRHQREQKQLAVLLIDLDRFKQVNERLGHAAGDDVLRRVGSTLRDAIRGQDTVARQGGDEFAVLAPGTDDEGAAMLTTRLCDRLNRVQFAGDTVGATIGWAVYPSDGLTAAALLANADARLLAAKRSFGRPPMPAAEPNAVAGPDTVVLGPATVVPGLALANP